MFEIPVSYQVFSGSIVLIPSPEVRFSPSIPGIMDNKTITAKSSFEK
jgi:hypothetical protein